MRKGSHLTEEHKKKLSEKATGRPYNGIVWNKGLTRATDPRVDRMYSMERAAKQRYAFLGRKVTWGDKVSKAKKGKPIAIAGWNKGLPAWNRGLTKETDERVAKYARAGLERFQDPEWVKYFFECCEVQPNKAEQKLMAILDKYFPYQWQFVGDGNLVIGGKIPDFANVNGKKQVIELFGSYWHQGEDPQKRINSFMHFGFSALVIWENELESEDAIVEKVKNFPSIETLHGAYLLGKRTKTKSDTLRKGR